MLWQRKELVAIYLFEECYCDVFLNANLTASGTDYSAWIAYGLLFLLGLGMSHCSRKQEGSLPLKSKILGKFRVWLQRFPIITALLSIAFVLCGEMLEQVLLENISQLLLSPNNILLFALSFPLLNTATLLIDLWSLLPVLLPFICFLILLNGIYHSKWAHLTTQELKAIFRKMFKEKVRIRLEMTRFISVLPGSSKISYFQLKLVE